MKPLRIALMLSLLAGTTGLHSCLSAPDYDIVPNIDFDSISVERIPNQGNQVTVTVSFQDGDGDLGLGGVDAPASDTEPPYTEFINNQRNRYFNNYFVQLQVRRGQAAFKDTLIGTVAGLDYNGRYPRLSDTEKKEPLKGTITRTIPISETSVPNNTDVRFKIVIADRALHESNVAITEPVHILY
jgi:hypothetical protein